MVLFARQTALPFTKMAEAFNVVPEAFPKKKAVVVAFVVLRFEMMALEAERAVVVTFVKVAFVAMRV